MNQTSLESPDWYKATTLNERVEPPGDRPQSAENIEVNLDRARRRLERWRSEPFANGSGFTERLALDGITEGQLLLLLGESSEAMRQCFAATPAWLVEMARAFSRPDAGNEAPQEPGEEILGFMAAIQPLVDQARDDLREGIQGLVLACSTPPFDPATIENILFAHMPKRLSTMLGRTMALELNVARLQGILEGDTSEERFRSFVRHVSRCDVALALMQEYPVLARQLTICLRNWVSSSMEFLHRLNADWDAVREALTPGNDPGMLVEMDRSVGDPHRDGRTVGIAKFSSGFQVVYKPRPLAVDAHFHELLEWLNDRGDHPPFHLRKVLDRGSYGWLEYIPADECSRETEVRRFYERQGALLAVLYALEATDFHMENLVAAGEHPVLLDVEALFHPRVEGMNVNQIGDSATSAINHSVLRVGLLPNRELGADYSGLGSIAGQITPYRVAAWDGMGTDELQLCRKRVAMRGSQNRPTLNGVEIRVLDYVEDLVTGFAGLYRLLLKQRGNLLARGGPILRFAEDEVRVVVRSTLAYFTLLQESFHPDVLRDALDRDRLFDQLWLAVQESPYLRRVISSEREDLLKGDIPLFTTHPNSRNICSSSGRLIADCLDESSLELVRHRLEHLSEEDLSRQIWFIRASLAALSSGEDAAVGQDHHPIETSTRVDGKRLLEAARTIGDRLAQLALRGGQSVSWIGLTMTNMDYWQPAPLETDLYDGLPGIALFLAYLGEITHEAGYTDMARSALVTLRQQIEQSRSTITTIGAFDGWGGIIYALCHLSRLWNDQSLLDEAEQHASLLPALIERDAHLDIISGSAGCIGSLVSLHRCTNSRRALAMAIKCGDRLLAGAQAMDHGVGWILPGIGAKPLAGFSHGAAGIAWALLELSELSGEERFSAIALDAIAYERSLFSAEQGNWPDLREAAGPGDGDSDNPARFMVAWCHGAPGIGLARLRCLRFLHDKETRGEIETALRTTLDKGFGANHSLCHGDLGNLEVLLQAAETLGPEWQTRVDRIAGGIVKSIDRVGWLCGNPLRVESPGLMTGLAGIGYELLRLAQPAWVPSVLALSLPIF